MRGIVDGRRATARVERAARGLHPKLHLKNEKECLKLNT